MIYLLEITDIIPVRYEIQYTIRPPKPINVRILPDIETAANVIANSQNLLLFSQQNNNTAQPNIWYAMSSEIVKELKKTGNISLKESYSNDIVVYSSQISSLTPLEKEIQQGRAFRYKRLKHDESRSIINKHLEKYKKYINEELVINGILKRFPTFSIPYPALMYTLENITRKFELSPQAGVSYLQQLSIENQNLFDQWQLFEIIISPNYTQMHKYFGQYLLYNDVYQTIALLKKGITIMLLLKSGLTPQETAKLMRSSPFFVQNLNKLLTKRRTVNYSQLADILQTLNNTIFNIRTGKGPDTTDIFLTGLLKIAIINNRQ